MAERTVVSPPEQTDCAASEPFLRVVRGNPTPDEIAALVIVFMGRCVEQDARPARKRRSAWADPGTVLSHARYPARPSAGATREQ
jgi:hypothetical protein